jgi:hypothetical protein
VAQFAVPVTRQRLRRVTGQECMRILVFGVALASAGCSISTIDPDAYYPSVDLDSAVIVLDGDRIAEIAIEATVTGPVIGGPIISGGNIVTPDRDVITDLELTTGDQEFYPDRTLFLVDTRRDAPAALRAACGTVVMAQVYVGGKMAGGHVETSTNVIDTTVQCF